MNGIHDMGGMHGFGAVKPEADEPPFHAQWEERVLAMQRAMRFTRAWNIDMSRDAQERLPAEVYLSVSYYERWELGIERNAVERGLVSTDEIAAGHALQPGTPVERVMTIKDIEHAFTRGSFARVPEKPPRFKPGERVRTKNINPPTHTRLPRYARGREGTIEAIRGWYAVVSNLRINGKICAPSHRITQVRHCEARIIADPFCLHRPRNPRST